MSLKTSFADPISYNSYETGKQLSNKKRNLLSTLSKEVAFLQPNKPLASRPSFIKFDRFHLRLDTLSHAQLCQIPDKRSLRIARNRVATRHVLNSCCYVWVNQAQSSLEVGRPKT